MMKKIVIGILAHVDAGKTTLTEAMLYRTGTIRKQGRVDHGDTFLDHYELERKRGITIFSKLAHMKLAHTEITILDTPGHVDFSAEMERTLQVLDYAVIVVSGTDGVQGHTETLVRLLERYRIPAFFFVNKMDLSARERGELLDELQSRFGSGFVDFSDRENEAFFESAALGDEAALDEYMETGTLRDEAVQRLIAQRKLFPCYFGSALLMDGVEELLKGLDEDTRMPDYPDVFGARVYKIGRDEQGKRLCYLKVTGGNLKAKQPLDIGENEREKADTLRIYSGEKYQTVQEVKAGEICAVTGLNNVKAGMGLGGEKEGELPLLEPVLTYRVILPEDTDAAVALGKLRELEEEEPELHIVWNEQLKEIHARVMGEIQMEILANMIKDRFGFEVTFGEGSIVYRETIKAPVIGVGHYEPLKHYAEVQLLLEPAERGSGLSFASSVGTDDLALNWQRLILTHLAEKVHSGVLTGSPVTDLKITLIAGRAHQKHTEGGDFRQATYRAVRQGLKKAESILLEPYYRYRLEVPTEQVGRAMTDLQGMAGTVNAPVSQGEFSILEGTVPVSAIHGYTKEVLSYTGGRGKLRCTLAGYEECHNEEEVIAGIAYDSEADVENPTGSVFCAHGAGFYTDWQETERYKHLHPETKLDDLRETSKEATEANGNGTGFPSGGPVKSSGYVTEEEIEKILGFRYRDRKFSYQEKQVITTPEKKEKPYVAKWDGKKPAKQYLLVDGYNLLFANEELTKLAKTNLDAARTTLMDRLCNYQGYHKQELILVFDAYKVKGRSEEVSVYHNIHVVYTKEAQTADAYIEKATHELAKKHDVTVVTSDGLEQLIILGNGGKRVSSREFWIEMGEMEKEIRKEWLS